ncbi:MAG TPA: VOC family protein [Actinomycetota bacterium]|jgi:predicted enzyme related to lactoylglutathione lyase|nr:VOC family protein [Actinomycetota bacterium]
MGQRLVHFEITADDPGRAVEFYRTVFGWEFATWEGPQTYFPTTTGKDEPGIDGAVMARSELLDQAVVNTIQVQDHDASAKAVREAGGEVIQDKHAVPGVGWFSYCRDTEGNVFGILEGDPSAS